MLRWSSFFAFTCAAAVSSASAATDYAKIDRTIREERAYETELPRYALLLFGRDASLRVWVVIDGERVYIDRNGDGDLSGDDERFEKYTDCENIEIADHASGKRYVITNIGVYKEGDPPQPHLMVEVDVKGPIEYHQYCDTAMEQSPSKSKIAHFDGPLTIGPRTINWKLPPKLSLATGEKPTDLPANIGTMNAEYGCWVVVRTHDGDKSAFQDGVVPLVEVEFPSKTPGGPAIKKRYDLDKFC